jgi:hypothetical protein
MMYNELPPVEQVERLVAAVPADSLSAQERRTLTLGEPRRIGPSQQHPAGMTRARAPRVMRAPAAHGAPSGVPPRAARAAPQRRPQKPAAADASEPRSWD